MPSRRGKADAERRELDLRLRLEQAQQRADKAETAISVFGQNKRRLEAQRVTIGRLMALLGRALEMLPTYHAISAAIRVELGMPEPSPKGEP